MKRLYAVVAVMIAAVVVAVLLYGCERKPGAGEVVANGDQSEVCSECCDKVENVSTELGSLVFDLQLARDAIESAVDDAETADLLEDRWMKMNQIRQALSDIKNALDEIDSAIMELESQQSKLKHACE